MMSRESKEDAREMVAVLLRLDKLNISILTANANALLARQELEAAEKAEELEKKTG